MAGEYKALGKPTTFRYKYTVQLGFCQSKGFRQFVHISYAYYEKKKMVLGKGRFCHLSLHVDFHLSKT
jgi:hypothetical protein